MNRVWIMSAGILASITLTAVWAELGGWSSNGKLVSPGFAEAAEDAPAAEKAAFTKRLEGTSWDLHLMPLSGSQAKSEKQDTVTFLEGKLSSRMLSEDGYPASNISVTLGDSGPVWETMQTSDTEGVAFWRGEFRGDKMRGILSIKPKDGGSKDYSFVAEQKAVATTPPPAPPVAESMPEAAGDQDIEVIKTPPVVNKPVVPTPPPPKEMKETVEKPQAAKPATPKPAAAEPEPKESAQQSQQEEEPKKRGVFGWW